MEVVTGLLLPAGEHGARSPEPARLLPTADPFLPPRDRFRYLLLQPEPGLAPWRAHRSPHWFEPARQPAAWLPVRETRQPVLHEAFARIRWCARRQDRKSVV